MLPGLAFAEPHVGLSLDENPVELTRRALRASQTSVAVVVYKFDERGIRRALDDAVERGVAVRLVTDREEASRERSQIAKAAKAGAQVRVWPKDKLHAKFAIVDAEAVLTGSFNWTESAQHKNVELLLIIDQPGAIKQFQELFERLWDGSEPFDD